MLWKRFSPRFHGPLDSRASSDKAALWGSNSKGVEFHRRRRTLPAGDLLLVFEGGPPETEGIIRAGSGIAASGNTLTTTGHSVASINSGQNVGIIVPGMVRELWGRRPSQCRRLQCV
jgi:hypothetical protein